MKTKEYVQRNYRIRVEHDKKVKKLAKKTTTKIRPSGSESEVIRRLIENA